MHSSQLKSEALSAKVPGVVNAQTTLWCPGVIEASVRRRLDNECTTQASLRMDDSFQPEFVSPFALRQKVTPEFRFVSPLLWEGDE